MARPRSARVKRKNFLASLLGGRRGQLAVVVPISLTLAVGGSLLWGYLQVMNSQVIAQRSAMDAETLVNKLLFRIERLLVTPSALAECTTGGLSIFHQFRALKNIPPPTKTYSALSPVPTTFDSDPSTESNVIPSCILSGATAGTGDRKSVAAATIAISQLGDYDKSTLTSQIQVTVAVETKPIDGMGAQMKRRAQKTRRYMLRLGSMAFYTLVLRPNGAASSAAPQIDVPTALNGGIDIAGYTLHTTTTAMDIQSVARQDGKTNFLKPVDFRAQSLLTGDTIFRSDYTNTVFRRGANFGVFNGVKMPFEAPSNAGDWNDVDAWNQSLDYSYVYESTCYGGSAPSPGCAAPNMPAPPLPDVGNNDELGNPMANVGPIPPNLFSNGLAVASPSTPTLAYNGARAALVSVLPTAGIIPRLSDTCLEDPNSPTTFVYIRRDSDLVINFNTDDNALCALIIARNVVINVNNGQNNAIFGTVVAQQVTLGGAGGRVTLSNPIENQPVPGLVMPKDLTAGTGAQDLYQATLGSISRQIQTLGTNFGRNFFVPFARDTSLLPWTPTGYASGASRVAGFRPTGADLYTEPCPDDIALGVALPRYCVVGFIRPPDVSGGGWIWGANLLDAPGPENLGYALTVME